MRDAGAKPRTAKTLGGEIEYERTVYECPSCRKSAAPLDGELGVETGERLSRGVKDKVMFAAAMGSYEEASYLLRVMRGLRVSKAECERAANEEGNRRDGEQRALEAALRETAQSGGPLPGPAPERMVIQADAASVTTVKGEENKSVYCGVVFDAGDRQTKEGSERPFLARKAYTGSAVDMEDFGPRLHNLARGHGMGRAKAVAFVADGAPCLWKWAGENIPPHVEVVLIQDAWHVIKHLKDLAAKLWGEGSEAAAARVARWKETLLRGGVDEIIAELRTEHARRRGKPREALQKEIQYLINGRERMDYPRYEAEGWPIGSGAIESTCKNLVKSRFDITGARWRRDNIPAMFALRIDILNRHDFAADPPEELHREAA